MKVSFATLGCPGWNLDQIASNAKAMGYDGVELRGIAGEHVGPDEPPAARAAIKQLFAQTGVEIACIMGYSQFAWDDPAKRESDIEVAIKYIGLARDLECPVLRLFGGQCGKTGRDEGIRRVVAGLKKVAPHAEKAGVSLALETHDDWCIGANVRAILDGVKSNALGVCWDMCNSYFVEPLEKTFDAIGDAVVHVHFKDAARDVAGKHVSKLPGGGEVDMRKALNLLRMGCFQGYLSFEWEKKWEPALEEPEVAFPHYYKFITGLMREVGALRG